jgi:hypothetical protein
MLRREVSDQVREEAEAIAIRAPSRDVQNLIL